MTIGTLLKRLMLSAVFALPIGLSLAMIGSFLGAMLAEALVWLGVLNYDRSVPDSELDVWFPFAAAGALGGGMGGVALSIWGARKA